MVVSSSLVSTVVDTKTVSGGSVTVTTCSVSEVALDEATSVVAASSLELDPVVSGGKVKLNDDQQKSFKYGTKAFVIICRLNILGITTRSTRRYWCRVRGIRRDVTVGNRVVAAFADLTSICGVRRTPSLTIHCADLADRVAVLVQHISVEELAVHDLRGLGILDDLIST